MSFLAMAYIFFETVVRGFAGVSCADATAANKTTAVKSFIDVPFGFEVLHHYGTLRGRLFEPGKSLLHL
jgi:hypothetical protein